MIKVQQKYVSKYVGVRLILALAIGLSLSAVAVVDGHLYPFEQEEQTKRFKTLAQNLRCPTCQNQNIADSNSLIAKNLRQELYAMVLSGQSEQEILDFMVARYGDFVLYQPPMKTNTYFLWFGPLIIFVLILLVWGCVVWRQSRAKTDSVTAPSTQQKRLAEALLTEYKLNQTHHPDKASPEQIKF